MFLPNLHLERRLPPFSRDTCGLAQEAIQSILVVFEGASVAQSGRAQPCQANVPSWTSMPPTWTHVDSIAESPSSLLQQVDPLGLTFAPNFFHQYRRKYRSSRLLDLVGLESSTRKEVRSLADGTPLTEAKSGNSIPMLAKIHLDHGQFKRGDSAIITTAEARA